MKDNQQIREDVSAAYTKAARSATGCCGGGTQATSCCGAPEPAGITARTAGYTLEELSSIPIDAALTSFGCGNPLAYSQVKPGQVVLDLGSGAGIDILLAGRVVGPEGRVIGVDMTDEMIERAQQNIASSGLSHVEVRKGIIEALPVEDNTVDWVISNCVINLSPEKSKVFSEIHRVLRPGGQISISDIVVQELPDWVRGSAVMYNSCVAGAVSEEAYLDGLRQAGLEQVSVTERLVYDANQLAAFIGSEVDGLAGDGEVQQLIAAAGGLPAITEALAGKIWSAKFAGTKA